MTAAMIGCSSDDAEYTPAEPIDGAYIYFSSEAATTYSLNADDTSIVFDVFRNDAEGMLDVPVAIEFADDDYASLFTADNAVIFEDGVKATTWELSFDREAMTEGSDYVLTVTFDDPTLTSPYAASSLTLTLKVPEPWDSMGDAIYIDAWTFDEEYKGELFRHRNNPNRFMLRVPYDTAVEEEGYYEYDGTGAEYITFTLLQPGKSSLNGIPITEEDLVYFEPFSTGAIDDQYGVAWEMNHPVMFASLQSESAWLNSRVLSYQDAEKTLPAIVQFAPMIYMDGVGAYNYSTYNGVIQIIFPGVVLSDYAVEITYAGHLTDPKNNHFAVAEVTGGEDVEYIEVAMGAGDDPEAVFEAYLEGEIEAVRIEGTSGRAQFAVEEDGTYTIIAVSYGDGEPQEVSYTTFKFYIGATPEISPLENDYTADDFYGIDKKELFKDWIMWAVDPDDEDGITARQPITIVTFSESDETYEDEYGEYDLINIEGFGLGLTKNDAHLWEYYEGFILNFYLHDNIGQWNGYYVNYIPYVGGMGSYNAFYEEIMLGGLVDEGYMALAYSDFYNLGGSPEPNGFQWNAYLDEACTNSAGYLMRLYNIMFEDPAVSSLLAKAASLKAPKAVSKNELKTLAQSLSVRENYVETARGMAHRKIDEMRAAKAAKSAVRPTDDARRSNHGAVVVPASVRQQLQAEPAVRGSRMQAEPRPMELR